MLDSSRLRWEKGRFPGYADGLYRDNNNYVPGPGGAS